MVLKDFHFGLIPGLKIDRQMFDCRDKYPRKNGGRVGV